MKKIAVTIMFISLLFVFGQNNYPQVFNKLEQAYKSGTITSDEMLLNKFFYMFESSKVNKALIPGVSNPIKCGTQIIMEYINLKSSLSKSTQDIIDNYLTITATTSDFISPGGHFKISYSTTGEDAVPSADNNYNGIPDYVEWIASYLETAWNVEITQCGFEGPVDTQGDGYYNVSFKNMNDYGYTDTRDVDGNEGTRLVLHNNFLGFPGNQDPEGNQKGAAKVTCAHEFKHASQYLYATWESVGYDWIELDAAWVEELVFDYVNDTMLNFTGLGTGDPFSSPGLPLDEPWAPSVYFYGKYFWQDFLHQKFDNNSYTSAPIILAF